MLELLLAAYGTMWWLVFKKFKLLPINLWTQVTTVFLLLATLAYGFIILNRYQPTTPFARFYVVTTPVVVEVKGRVTEVLAEESKPLKAGDVLFKLDPTQYQARVDSLTAQLKNVQRLAEQEAKLVEQGAGNANEALRLRTEVDRLSAELRGAQYDVDACVVKAPSDGYATQVLLRPGQVVTPMPLQPVMVFIHKHKPIFVAGFVQEVSANIDADDRAEVAFHAVPGRVFKAKVKRVLPQVAESQLTPGGRLIGVDEMMRRGRVPVSIEMVDDVSDLNLPQGATATVAVFTGKHSQLDIVRRIILRIHSWENFLFLP